VGGFLTVDVAPISPHTRIDLTVLGRMADAITVIALPLGLMIIATTDYYD